MSALLLAVLLAQNTPAPLAEYVGKDLSKLSGSEMTKFSIAFIRATSMPERTDWPAPEPRFIAPYPSGQIAWLSIHVYPGYDVPDLSFAVAHSFDRNWKHLSRIEFPTGYRLRTRDAQLIHDKHVSQPLIRITVDSVGPFIMSKDGKSKKPLFHPDTGIREYYAFDGSNAMLIRLTDGQDHLLSCSYRWDKPDIGPDPGARTIAYWMSALESDDPARQLECLVWLSGTHLSSKDWRRKGYSREPVRSSEIYEAVRARPTTKQRLNMLFNNSNDWIKAYALFAKQEIAKPFELDSSPP